MRAVAARASRGRTTERSRARVLRDVRVALRIPVAILGVHAGIPTSTVTAYELGRKPMNATAEHRLKVALVGSLNRALRAAAAAEGLGLTRPAPRLRRAS